MKALNRIVFPRFSRKDIGMRSIVIALVCTLMPTVALSTEYVAPARSAPCTASRKRAVLLCGLGGIAGIAAWIGIATAPA